MLNFTDSGLIISVKPHGDTGAIIRAFTQTHGICAGYLYGAQSQSKRAAYEPGNYGQLTWKAKTETQLGHYDFEPEMLFPAYLVTEPPKLILLQASIALLQTVLSERHPYPDLFTGTLQLYRLLNDTDDVHIAMASYIMWEIHFLASQGFALAIDKCVQCAHVNTDVTHVSPKTGAAVCADHAAPYVDKLLVLPPFLRGDMTSIEKDDIKAGLTLTQHFIQKFLFDPVNKPIPAVRHDLITQL